jgi:hypothetical protein
MQPNQQSEKLIIAVIFAAAVCFLLPIPGIIFDILIFFGLSIALASIIIFLFADSLAKAKDYPAFMTFASVVYSFISVATVKFAIFTNPGSRFFQSVSSLPFTNSTAASISATLIIFAMLYIVFMNLLKNLNREMYFIAGGDKNFIENLKFFAKLPASVSILFIQAAVVVSAVLFIGLFRGQADDEIAQTGFTANLSLLVELPILFVLSSCGRIVKKIVENEDRQAGRKTVIATDISADAQSDFDIRPEKISFNIKDAHWENEGAVKTFEFRSQKLDNAEGFEKIAELITGLSSNSKVVLFTSGDTASVKVTLPVNVAIRLARQGKKCLLADFDFANRAVTEVFDIRKTKNAGRNFYPAPIKNLFIAPDFAIEGVLRSFEMLKDAFDFVIVYLPKNTKPAEYEILLKYADAKLLF